MSAEQSNGVRRELYHFGKRIYRWMPLRYRDRLIQRVYENIGFLFGGMPHYENWLISQTHVWTNSYASSSLIDIDLIQQARSPQGNIAIHLHMFYADLIHEFASYVNNMPFPYDLYVSVCDHKALARARQLFVDLTFCKEINIKLVRNRGRDIAPFICTFGDEFKNYDYIAHLHGKKSLYNDGATQGWREYLCEGLLGSPDRIRRIFSLLGGGKPYGIVYPQVFVRLPYMANTWLANRGLAQIWCRRLGMADIPGGYFDFPAGSMFWARGDALAPLFNAKITLDDFPEEAGQTDGTLAHCIERLFVLSSLKQGLPPGIIRDEDNPSWSAWRFDQYVNRPYRSLLQHVDFSICELAAFDVFDTLLCRPLLNPESIKEVVARRVGGEIGTALPSLSCGCRTGGAPCQGTGCRLG
ncbi:MAG: rhamnan synthesis F family protein [Syntrophobacteraceae bacterium]